MRIQLSRAHYPVTTLGPGRRIGVWFQGCHIRCLGCVSRDTWQPDPAREIAVEELLGWCRSVASMGPDGVTISGGEPFDQAEALSAFLDGLAAWRQEVKIEFDILCYSGLALRQLRRRFAHVLGRLDALIPEPYVESRPPSHLWRGSANQPLVFLSLLGQQRYARYAIEREPEVGTFQFTIEDGFVWCIGLPNRGDMARLEESVRRRGLSLGRVSWRE